MPDLVFATSTTSVTNENGLTYRLVLGEAWDANDPIVETYPQLFSKTPPKMRTSHGVVETATQAPGEKRKSGR